MSGTKASEARPTFEEYPVWHRTNLGEDLEDDSLRRWYEINVRAAQTTLLQHKVSGLIEKALSKRAADSTLARNQPSAIAFAEKPFASVLDKLFRLNCNWNKNYPKPPKSDWLRCANVFEHIDDLVRSTIICRYIDGPQTVCNEIISAATSAELAATSLPKATNEGYYAHHVILKFPFELLGRDNTTRHVNVQAEIQVTTQMQDVLKDLTHVYYRKQRLAAPVRETASHRWDFKSESFRATYLGHTLHLIEGVVAELRQAEKNLRSSQKRKPRGD